MAVYVIAIIPMILMIVDITKEIDASTKTAAYADDATAAGKIIQLVENTLHARCQIRILPRSIEIMVNCKRKSQTTRIHGLQCHYNQNHN